MLPKWQRSKEQLGFVGGARGLLFRLLQAGVAARRKATLELLNPARRIDVLQLACKERMAGTADIDLQFLPGAPRRKAIAATASDYGILVARMDAVLHGIQTFGSGRLPMRPGSTKET